MTSRRFQRSMKIFGVLLLTLSSVTPASSVFVIIPGVIQQAGSGVVISLLAAGLVSFCMAFVYAELASAWPIAGGEYAMAGQALGPFAGYVLLGVNAATYTLVPPVLALGAATYVSVIWPHAPAVPIAVGMILVSTFSGILNVRVNAWVTGVFLAVEVVALIVVAALGFAHPARSLTEAILHPVMATGAGLSATPPLAIALSTTVAIFALNGYGAAVYFSEEMHEAPKRIARTIVLALVATLALEFAPTLAIVIGAPDIASTVRSASPFGDFVQALGGRGLAVAVSLAVAFAIVNAVIASLLINARILYASGRDGAWNHLVNDIFTRLHVRFDSPWAAMLVTGAAGVACCFIPLKVLLVLNGMGVVVTYVSMCVAVIAGRLNGSSRHAHYRMPFFPVAPIVGLMALAGVVAAGWIDAEVGRPSLLVTFAEMALFGGYYLWRRRSGGFAWALSGMENSPPLTDTARNLEVGAS
ncbi:MAG TPA: APC family permease [Caulobacteraceae bacterium]|jgi:amino acid transporter